jgi:hypothetical protein
MWQYIRVQFGDTLACACFAVKICVCSVRVYAFGTRVRYQGLFVSHYACWGVLICVCVCVCVYENVYISMCSCTSCFCLWVCVWIHVFTYTRQKNKNNRALFMKSFSTSTGNGRIRHVYTYCNRQSARHCLWTASRQALKYRHVYTYRTFSKLSISIYLYIVMHTYMLTIPQYPQCKCARIF